MKRMGQDLKQLTAVHRAAADKVAADARLRAPVRTGRLRKSIRAGATTKHGSVSAGGRLVPYAGPIHFGWPRRNIEPQPFLYDALDHRRAEVIELYEKRVDELIRRADRDMPG